MYCVSIWIISRLITGTQSSCFIVIVTLSFTYISFIFRSKEYKCYASIFFFINVLPLSRQYLYILHINQKEINFIGAGLLVNRIMVFGNILRVKNETIYMWLKIPAMNSIKVMALSTSRRYGCNRLRTHCRCSLFLLCRLNTEQ